MHAIDVVDAIGSARLSVLSVPSVRFPIDPKLLSFYLSIPPPPPPLLTLPGVFFLPFLFPSAIKVAVAVIIDEQ